MLELPPVAAGVIVLFAAMPTGANAYIFAVQYQRLLNPVSGAVAPGTLLAAVTLPVVVMVVARLAARRVPLRQVATRRINAIPGMTELRQPRRRDRRYR
ncbi:hypothetical protein [Bradyrhizobium sp. Bra78]|uniref:hypothetical protein n=1 Tax=Bradyrhizobium sp. Bra78 TaxID=2926010 RepID=UPI0021C72D83|nr:hypothetical protein [Bradyrhizobium sp. Bra78]